MLEINKIHHGDCLELMKGMESESVNAVITDPPYGIAYKSNSGSREYKDKMFQYDWDADFNFGVYFDEIIRILKNDSYMMVFGRHENIKTMLHLGCDRILIWDKGHNGMGDLECFGIGYEWIFLFKKGKPKIKGKRVNGVIPHTFYGTFGNAQHPTQKPVSLIKYLLTKISCHGDVVFDPFMGSGTTALASIQTGRNYIGIEMEQKYIDIANNRLAQKSLPDTLLNFQ